MLDEMPPKMRRFLAKPPRRISEGAVAARRSKSIRRGQPSNLDLFCMMQEWRCAYCHRNMRRRASPKHPGRHATLDHVLPICRGGDNRRSNLVAACDDCNRRKGSMTGDEFRAASAIEARSDATGTGAAEGESATRKGDAQEGVSGND